MARGRGRGRRTRGRGRGHGPSTSNPSSSSPSHVDTELPITYIEGGMLMPAHQVSARITKIFKRSRLHEDGYCWKKVSANHKERYFEKFKKYYTWDKTIDVEHVRAVFMKQAQRRYRDMISTFKRNRDLRKPTCVPDATWQSWLEHWSKPEVIAKSAKARQNRMTEVAGCGTGCSRHTGGSRTTIEHSHALRAELHHDPDAYECFKRTHMRKDGTFVDERSRRITEEVQARVAAATQRAEAIDMSQLYLDVVGGVKKQRVYGVGSKALTFYGTGPTTCRATSQETLRREVAEEMQEQFNQQMEERDARLLGQLQTEMEAQMGQMRDYMTRTMEDIRRQGHLPPPA